MFGFIKVMNHARRGQTSRIYFYTLIYLLLMTINAIVSENKEKNKLIHPSKDGLLRE